MKEKATIVTHNGDFHSDEIMGVAILLLALQAKAETKVIRTRDENLISQADIVLDVGGIYDPDQNRFDHHQAGGAGIRENSIPYASCGLVWKKYGSQLCDNNELIAKKVEDSLIIPIDAGDNGIDTYKQIREEVGPVTLQNILSSFAPTYLESYTTDEVFLEVVSFAKRILEREIAHAKAVISAKDTVTEAYNKQTEEAGDKRLLILDQHLPWFELVADFPELLFVVYPNSANDTWRVKAVRKDSKSFESKKYLPQEWAGKKDAELAEISGVPDATFCHNARFMAVAKSKEGAIDLAEKALTETT